MKQGYSLLLRQASVGEISVRSHARLADQGISLMTRTQDEIAIAYLKHFLM